MGIERGFPETLGDILPS